ncbi:MAG TPA: Glu-tRNA(Gln) amidotransferase GatDE subunit D, partial [bacterium]|nr:Glu-tRNA(Gln) amidotransferase GatDE subunit D [bacterium]
MNEILKGYKGEGRKLLEKNSIEIWDIIEIETDGRTYNGILLPRSEYSAPEYIEIKLKNNYNIGIKASSIIKIEKVGKQEVDYKIP